MCHHSVLDAHESSAAAAARVVGSGGSEANFNPGTTIRVKVQLQDGSTDAPTCITDGFTLESNNLGLNKCKSAGGKTPAITFTESN